MQRCFAWTKKARFKLWTGWIAACRYPQAERKSMALSINRHGTLSLYAALNPKTGEVIGQTAPRHTSQEFVAFLI